MINYTIDDDVNNIMYGKCICNLPEMKIKKLEVLEDRLLKSLLKIRKNKDLLKHEMKINSRHIDPNNIISVDKKDNSDETLYIVTLYSPEFNSTWIWNTSEILGEELSKYLQNEKSHKMV